MYDFLGIASGVIGMAGYVPYVRDILRRSTQPDRISWLIWMLEYAMLLAAQFSKGATSSLWLGGLQLVGVIIVFGLSFRFGVGGLDRHKSILMACIGLAMIVWLFTSNATIAIMILLAIEGSGVVLTVLKVYRQPGSETLSFWVLISIAGATGITAVQPGQASVLYLYPIFMIFVGITVISASYLGAQKRTQPAGNAIKITDQGPLWPRREMGNP
jgi:hypothetical protein